MEIDCPVVSSFTGEKGMPSRPGGQMDLVFLKRMTELRSRSVDNSLGLDLFSRRKRGFRGWATEK